MAENRGRNQANDGAWSFGDMVKYIQFGLANPVFIDAASFNPLLSQVFPTRTVDQSCSQGNSQRVRGGTSSAATSTKKQTTYAPGAGQKRYKYTKLPSSDEYPPSYDECVQSDYTSPTEK